MGDSHIKVMPFFVKIPALHFVFAAVTFAAAGLLLYLGERFDNR